jgi:hypothetical protein
MNDILGPKLPSLDATHEQVAAAIRRAVRDALLAHARAGNPVPVGANGRVVWLSPEEVLRRYDAVPDGTDKTA